MAATGTLDPGKAQKRVKRAFFNIDQLGQSMLGVCMFERHSRWALAIASGDACGQHATLWQLGTRHVGCCIQTGHTWHVAANLNLKQLDPTMEDEPHFL